MRFARSIHSRLLIGGGLAICLALAIAGAGLVLLFQRHVEHREALSMEAKARELLPMLRIDAMGRPMAAGFPSDGRFWRAASGLYWQASTNSGAIRSTSLWDQRLSAPAEPSREAWSLSRTNGPFGHRLIVISRIIRPAGSNEPVLVQFASDDDALVLSLREFRNETALALVLLWLVLLVAAGVQIRLGLRPLLRVQGQVERLRGNPSARLSNDHPREIAHLVEAINALADARAADVQRARHRAADLAHSLKTPLAAMAAQSRRARSEGAPDAADAIDRTLAVARAALETELARARSALARGSNGETADLTDVVDNVISVLEQTEKGGSLVYDVHVDDGLAVPVAAPETTEVIGALMENAVRFARRGVAISCIAEAGKICVFIDDDGPGMDAGRIDDALARGARLDEAGSGHGFGLAIVKELVDATGGTMAFAEAPIGGLRVALNWTSAA
ncbi:HAMP domain-containing sensor histidine kinase [Novosphingobium sp. fls2-241-R2A-195]|uniref:sensor histidine kinase n=1 Tax=Novosphingobium sp. fls2-241-R2A-195 TaxID=3040296 RepID=UPI00254FB74E|nr:HAMP domain-containing sensor histidine kinase [Novosphingobium sp. fls2-241-R2A-195]